MKTVAAIQKHLIDGTLQLQRAYGLNEHDVVKKNPPTQYGSDNQNKQIYYGGIYASISLP